MEAHFFVVRNAPRLLSPPSSPKNDSASFFKYFNGFQSRADAKVDDTISAWITAPSWYASSPQTATRPLNPGRVRVKLNKDSFPYKLSHYEFTIDGKVFRFEPYQILHLKYPDPNDPFVGVGFVLPLP
jgi:hypothetical protein